MCIRDSADAAPAGGVDLVQLGLIIQQDAAAGEIGGDEGIGAIVGGVPDCLLYTSLQRMGQGVHCGVDGIALRQTEGQVGIEDGGKRDDLRVEDLALAVGLGLADDGGDGDVYKRQAM